MSAMTPPRRLGLRWMAPLVVLTVLGGCNNGAKDDDGDDEEPIAPGVNIATVVLDSNSVRLQGDSAERASGRFRFLYTGREPEVEAGTIIVGAEQGGYLRKVTSVVRSGGGELEVRTAQASLNEAIDSGSFQTNVSLPLTSSAPSRAPRDPGIVLGPARAIQARQGVTATPTGLHFAGVSLEEELCDDATPRTCATLDGSLEFTPVLDVGARIGFSEVKEFHAIGQGTLDLNASVSLITSASGEYNRSVTLYTITRPFVTQVGPVPVAGTVRIDLIAKLSAGASISGTLSTGASATSTVSAGARYTDGRGWERVLQVDNNFTPIPPTWNQEAEVSARLDITPVLTVTFYQVLGPSIAADPYLDFDASLSGITWTADLVGGVDAILGFKVSIFSIDLADYNTTITGPRTTIYHGEGTFGQSGSLAGRVIDGVTRLPIQGATVTFQNTGIVLGSSTTDANGGFNSGPLTVGQYDLHITRTGYVAADLYQASIVPGTTQVGEIPLVPESPDPGGIGGLVKDARTGNPINGAQVEVRRGINNTSGTPFAATVSNVLGEYQVSGLPAGTYTVVGKLAGYSDGARTGISVGDQLVSNQDIILSPSTGSDVRVVLTWGSTPSDLDAHLTGPTSGSSRFHVFYSNQGSLTTSPFAALDLDDVSSFGPETMTITQVATGIYRYSVHDFTNRQSSSSTGLANSGATVELYVGGVLTSRFFVPNQGGTLWTVFEMDGTRITPINQMGYQSNPGLVTVRGLLVDDAEVIHGSLVPKQ